MNNKLVLSSLGHTWILDLDGTIVKHNGYRIDGKDSLLYGVEKFLHQIPEQDKIIFLTSRKEKYKDITEDFLKQNKIRYDHIIFDIPFGERIVVNDNKPSGLKMAYAIEVNRNDGIDMEILINECL